MVFIDISRPKRVVLTVSAEAGGHVVGATRLRDDVSAQWGRHAAAADR